MQYAGGILLQPVQTLVATSIFTNGKMQTNPSFSAIKEYPIHSDGVFFYT